MAVCWPARSRASHASRVVAGQCRCWALSPTAAPPNLRIVPAARVHGLRVEGDAQGDLHGLAEDGTALWRHHIGGAILALIAQRRRPRLAVGSASGCLVLLRKGSGTDPALLSTSLCRAAAFHLLGGCIQPAGLVGAARALLQYP